MGAILPLLEGEDDGEIPALISDAPEWLHTWFNEVRCWSLKEVDRERLVWVQCTGVPVHAWSKDFLRFIVTGFGEFVNFDEDTRKQSHLNVAKILVRTNVQDTISGVDRVTINGSIFPIRMTEVVFGVSSLRRGVMVLQKSAFE